MQGRGGRELRVLERPQSAASPPPPAKGHKSEKKKLFRTGQGAPSLPASLLKKHINKVIHSPFDPCIHDGPCTLLNCTCMQNTNFCTKHCLNGCRGPNTFLGCRCKYGECRTKACPCFASKRECDPDVCVCDAGTEACGEACCLGGRQKCLNDGIGFERSRRLGVAVSGVKDAGWGLWLRER